MIAAPPRQALPIAIAGGLACALLLACTSAPEDPAPRRDPTAAATPSPTQPPDPASTASPAASAATATATSDATATPAGPPAAVLVPAFPDLPEFNRPIAVLDLPTHDLYLLVLQRGRVLALPRDGPYDDPRAVLDHRDDIKCCSEQGLLSLALDPDFARNGYLYAYYSVAPHGATRLSRFATSGRGETFTIERESELVIYEVRQPFVNHNGGTILFGPDGMLYLGFGDGGGANDPRGHGQNTATVLGSVIRIDVSEASPEAPYAIPPDNPFLDDDEFSPETWAYGLRNPWRMSFDRETGLLWAGDVGQNRMEEVSIIRAGGNYGWNTMEGSTCFDPPSGCDREGLILPVWEYSHTYGCSITGGYVYRGEAIPALRGWYLFSDYCNGLIWAIHAETAADGRYVEPVLLWAGGPNAVVSFAEDADGELFLISMHGERIYRVVPPPEDDD